VPSVAHPHTPDGRYFVVRGRLWRLANPGLDEATKTSLVAELMDARRALRGFREDTAKDKTAERAARSRVDAAKRALGERGPVWWTDGAADFNRHMVANTPYASWFESLSTGP
jgi:hypothetical protein